MVATINIPDHVQAWEMVLGQLRGEMSRADFETWVKSLEPLGFLTVLITPSDWRQPMNITAIGWKVV